MAQSINLFYWSSKIFENKELENYGDLLSAYIVEQCSGREVQFFNAPAQRKAWFKKEYLMAIGSILSYATKKATVWGSGIISKEDTPGSAKYCAVRGPLSRKRIQELGYVCPEVYGDPALLLPTFYNPSISKTNKLGIVPHYVDYEGVKNDYGNEIKVIDLMTDNWKKTTDHICSCEAIISSSLHGVIVAHAYGIPAIWVQFSNKLSGDNTKYADYFYSVGLKPYEGVLINTIKTGKELLTLVNERENLPDQLYLNQIKEGLEQAFPLKYIGAS